MECGTHLIFGARIGAYKDSEITLAKDLAARLAPGMLCMADRLFPGYELWRQYAETGAHLLWRAKASVPLRKLKALSDGSWLAEWLPEDQRRKGEKALIVRVIEYRIKDPGTPDAKDEVYPLITTILDPAQATAMELAALYPQRWEIEITIKESKTILRKVRKDIGNTKTNSSRGRSTR